ncbi:hypothetical protein, partial [Hymenobacter aquaticus]|uniref:hypothetical protein n=1 Tax=Hymenobacter aquaticus TaxID=1867101 RepID=UPI001AEC0760
RIRSIWECKGKYFVFYFPNQLKTFFSSGSSSVCRPASVRFGSAKVGKSMENPNHQPVFFLILLAVFFLRSTTVGGMS